MPEREATELANEIGRIEGEMLSNESCAAIVRVLEAATLAGVKLGIEAVALNLAPWARLMIGDTPLGIRIDVIDAEAIARGVK